MARHVRAEAAALAARGLRVTVLAPGQTRGLVAAGRERIRRLADEGPDAVLGEPGSPLEIAIARAIPAGRRSLSGPFDLSDALQAVVTGGRFDVVHLHEPLAPTPALGVLREAPCATAATFHRPEALAGAAFLRPLIRRALDRLDLRIVTGETLLRSIEEVLPGDYALMRPGVDPALFPAGAPTHSPPGAVIVARSRERAGLRFALSALRVAPPEVLGPVTVIGPAEAAWRVRRIVPKAMRDRVTVVPDTGEEARAGALRGGRIVLFASPEELVGPVLGEALAAGAAVLAPRAAEVEGTLRHGIDALVLSPFARTEWQAAIAEVASDPGRRARLAAGAAARRRSWADVARELEDLYAAAIAARRDTRPAPELSLAADLRLRPPATIDAGAWVRACRAAGLRVVAVASPHGIAPALALAAAAPDDLAVVIGQEVATADGAIVGLFLTRDVPSGGTLEASVDAIRDQGGLVLVPHPEQGGAPSAAALRRVADRIDCVEAVSPGGGRSEVAAAGLLSRLGTLVTAGSGAGTPELAGAAWTELRPFHSPQDLMESLADATLHARPARTARSRNRATSRAGA